MRSEEEELREAILQYGSTRFSNGFVCGYAIGLVTGICLTLLIKNRNV
jgi:hypothetical protein